MEDRYEIRVSNRLGPALRSVFNDMQIVTVPQQTVITAWLSRDELRTLVLRMAQAGAQLVQLDCLGGER